MQSDAWMKGKEGGQRGETAGNKGENKSHLHRDRWKKMAAVAVTQ